MPLDGFEPWEYSDLVQNPIQETVDPRRYCQMAVAAVIMGDLNEVYAVEAAHRRQLLSAGSLQSRTMLLPGCAFPRSATIGDVYIDDLVILAMVHFSRLHVKEAFIPADALTHCTNHWVWLSPRRNVVQRSNMRCAEANWTECGESGVRHGAPSFIDAGHGDGSGAGTFWP